MFCIRAGLGHRVPGMFPFRGGISDYRMYVGHALRYVARTSLLMLTQALPFYRFTKHKRHP